MQTCLNGNWLDFHGWKRRRNCVTVLLKKGKIKKESTSSHRGANSFPLFFFFIWVLHPFQEYFTYIELIVHQRWAKTGESGKKKKHPTTGKQNLAFHTWPKRHSNHSGEKPYGLSQLFYPLGYGGPCVLSFPFSQWFSEGLGVQESNKAATKCIPPTRNVSIWHRCPCPGAILTRKPAFWKKKKKKLKRHQTETIFRTQTGW